MMARAQLPIILLARMVAAVAGATSAESSLWIRIARWSASAVGGVGGVPEFNPVASYSTYSFSDRPPMPELLLAKLADSGCGSDAVIPVKSSVISDLNL